MLKAFAENDVLPEDFKTTETLNAKIAGRMNQLGKEGWELVSFHKDTGFVFN